MGEAYRPYRLRYKKIKLPLIDIMTNGIDYDVDGEEQRIVGGQIIEELVADSELLSKNTSKKRENHNSEFQPLDEYEKIYKELHQKNVSGFFEKLVAESGINEEENRKTVSVIHKLQSELDVENKSLRKAYFRQILLIFLVVVCVLGFIGSIMVLSGWANEFIAQNDLDFGVLNKISLLVFILAVSFAGWSIFVIVKKIAPKIKELKANIANLDKRLQPIIEQAWQQMIPLNSLFEQRMSSRLMEETYPLIQLDDYFDIKRFDYLNRKYGLQDNSNKDISTLFIQSGEINGNPFCFFKMLNHLLGVKSYTGYLTIHWTESYRDSKGRSQTRTCSETLSANVTKPCPQYYEDCYLVYGNESAPNLSFLRMATDAEELSEKQLQKRVGKEIKKQNAQMRSAISRGENFTSMGNDFDALFGASDRDNEVEFRLLFTPIAQREMLKLLKDTTYSWGDDFVFQKDKMINIIVPEHLQAEKTKHKPEHLQARDITGNPKNYTHYDIDTIRNNFNDYNNEYFRAVYFAFAPLLAIPLYQQHKPHEFIYKDVYESRFSCFAHECAVNKMPASLFTHPEFATKTILKTKLHGKNGGIDNVTVTAYGYKAVERIDYVTVSHKSGIYQVPVNWIEYIPLQKESFAEISEQEV
jgi:hypothetical protein